VKIAALAGLAIATAFALPIGKANAQAPAWAFPIKSPYIVPTADDGKPKHVPGSTLTFTRSQIVAIDVQPPDWHPDEHPAMPGIVGHSRPPGVSACAFCHLPNGSGRPENASIAGLSANYIKAQLLAFREGTRPSSVPTRFPHSAMTAVAKELTTAEMDESAAYFAALKPRSYITVVEAAMVPRTLTGWMLVKSPEGGTEPIGNRIIELAEDVERFENRDSRATFIAYAPPGSLARGKALVSTGGAGRTLPCASCHGAGLKGLADVPRLAGRSPSYLFRQLYDMREGHRDGASAALMKPVVANLTDEDMVAIVAYLASRKP
jgi:cytochrome c553